MHKLPSKSVIGVEHYQKICRGMLIILFLLCAGYSSVFSQASPHGPITIECTSCHTTSSWKDMAIPMKFNHDATSFQLQGQHVTTACRECHTTLRFTGTAKDCYSCHQNDYIQSLNPNHQSGQFSHDCATCHSMNSWKQSIFKHSVTNFPLVGAHQALPCISCHVNGRMTGTPTECFSCHQTDYAQTVDPNHLTAQFPHDCLSCHAMTGWKPANFDHSKGNFPLLGAHQTLVCSSCHINNRYTALPTDCWSCHQTDYTNVLNPGHLAGQFSHDCTTCHSNLSWRPATFDHSKTNFILTGAHLTTQCLSCHKNNQYAGIPSDCWSCHQTDYTNVLIPNHSASNYDHNCTTCHSTMAWKPSTFDHSKTNFTLTGAHLTTDCILCHRNNQYSGLPMDCWSCHQTNYSSVTDPNHVTGNYDHLCTTCHTTTAWVPATFDHAKVNFQLTGAHVQTPCAQCHKNGVYQGTPTLCYTCHVTDYNNSVNPSHASAQFPTDCVTCHTTIGWRPSTFNHAQYFPIASGDVHSPGRWNFCSDCHVNSSNYKQFSCLTCHQHSQSLMDPAHQGESGYAYDSAHCYSCHPRGTH